MRPRPFLLGNWKCNHAIAQARAWASAYVAAQPTPPPIDVGLAPPATALFALAQEGLGAHLALSGQDTFVAHGAYTGAISAAMLRDAGARWVIVGHSERRALFGETDALIADKIRAAVAAGLKPVVCIGETRAEREAGQSAVRLRTQLQSATAALSSDGADWVLAYEPVWAIGATAATPQQVAATHGLLREHLRTLMGAAQADAVRIVYGGGVKAPDVAGLMATPDVDGLLVGGASLSAASFVAIVAAMCHATGSAPP